MSQDFDLILASGSPRRKDFLQNLGLQVLIKKPDIDESVFKQETPENYVVRMAKEKACIIAQKFPKDVVLAADTIVVLDSEIIGKPKDREDAKNIMRKLSGKTHKVYTAVCLQKGDTVYEHLEWTKVTFAKLDESLINTYVASGECDDKSGAYAVQGIGAMLIEKVEGSVSCVVGLPICQVRSLLAKFNIFPRTVHV